MTVQTVKFTSFGDQKNGRLITHCNGLEVVQQSGVGKCRHWRSDPARNRGGAGSRG